MFKDWLQGVKKSCDTEVFSLWNYKDGTSDERWDGFLLTEMLKY